MERTTIFSPDRRYRYTLWREWPAASPGLFYTEDPHLDYYPGRHSQFVQFIGLNPSTADEVADDPTIRRCVDFAQRWGFGSLCMTNVFAYRATDPRVLRKLRGDPVGPDNLRWLLNVAREADMIVCAWGNHGDYLSQGHFVKECLKILPPQKVVCFGHTSSGEPKHPLYLRRDSRLVPFYGSGKPKNPAVAPTQ